MSLRRHFTSFTHSVPIFFSFQDHHASTHGTRESALLTAAHAKSVTV